MNPDRHSQKVLKTWKDDKDSEHALSWIAAEWRYAYYRKRHNEMFTLGDGTQYFGYVNKNLPPGHSYYAFIRVQYNNSVGNYQHASTRLSDPIKMLEIALPSQSSNAQFNTIILAAIVGGFFFLSAIVFLIFRRKRYSGKQPYSSGIQRTTECRASDNPSPVKTVQPAQSNVQIGQQAQNLANHLELLRADGGLLLHNEWNTIKDEEELEQSEQEKNQTKCRYGNSKCPDYTRVKLSGDKFIHANWIPLYDDSKAIATQGPLPDTIDDFWGMIWEHNVQFIVMLCDLEERGRQKCAKYWPEKDMGSNTFGGYKITTEEESHLAHWSILKFRVETSYESREIHHIKFHCWPDCGVPEFPAPFLALLERVPKTLETPLVVHCSAGLGRTGCFLLAWSLLKQADSEGKIESARILREMRRNRPGLIQSEEQYLFVLESVVEALNSCAGDHPTLIAAKEIPNVIATLTKCDGEGTTGFDVEFKRLQNISSFRARAQAANLACNKSKNRLVNVLPYDSSRVYLRPIRGIEGSDYINASFVDGYKEKASYIATQAPMPNTTDDFWRMIWEYNVTMVVMLTKISELGREKAHRYWPEEKKARYTYYIVEPTTEFRCEGYIMREFLMTDARDGTNRTIRQFHFTGWPESAEVPHQADHFIDLIGQVHKTREQFGVVGPICIHCSAGVGRTGVFIGLTVILERLRCEGEVDIFQTVKLMRCRRPAMVQRVEQYQFMHRATLDYLQNFYLGGT